MIFESWPWKQELLRDGSILARWALKRPSERRAFLIEKKVFTAAYATRKLLEAHKLSTATEGSTLGCRAYPLKDGSKVTIHNWHRFDDLYDFSASEPQQLSLRSLMNLIIHSLVFAEVVDESGRVSGFLVTSDYSQEKLWEVPLGAFITLIQRIASDMPSSSVRIRDDASGEWRTWRGNGEPPKHFQTPKLGG